MAFVSKVAVGFWLERSNHFFGSLWPVSWLSPDELRRGDSGAEPFSLGLGCLEPGLARREASRARR